MLWLNNGDDQKRNSIIQGLGGVCFYHCVYSLRHIPTTETQTETLKKGGSDAP
jgi:hypothetical protein